MSVNLPDHAKQDALSRILQIVAAKSGKGIMYTAAFLGTIALVPGLELPGILGAIAGGIGIEAMGSIIDRVSKSEEIPDDEIRRQVEDAIAQSSIDALLTKEDFYHAFAHLRKGQRSLSSQSDRILTVLSKIQSEIGIVEEEQLGRTLRLNFDHLIETHTRLFAGRESYLQAILDFIKRNPSGYILVEALSGYGKTSLLAKLVQTNPFFAYHFISQAYKSYGSDFDPTEMESLLLNLCEQLETGTAGSHERVSPRVRFHSLLRSSPSDKPRVVVIDAVDEVNRHPNYLLGLLPENLPPGVFMILSARKLGDRDYLPEIGLRRSDLGIFIDLPGLDETAIAELLTMIGEEALPLATSQSFVQKLHQVSSGDPFYLRFLIEDVAQGIITPQNVERTPSGLNEYLDIQLSILDRSAHLPQQRDILGLILEAYGPLSRRDLMNMVRGLDGLNFDNVIRDIRRFLLVYNDTYTFCHNRFKEYFASRVL